jgi:hypothetical protein
VDPIIEDMFGDTQFFFSSAQDPPEESCLWNIQKFDCALISRSAPTVFVQGEQCAKEHELPVEAILPFAFPYSLGGPKSKKTDCLFT